MDRHARIVFGYHGTHPAFAERLIRGEVSIADWSPSTNEYDWLGHGIYFWEYAPDRAREWAGKGGVVGAIIRLGECLDLNRSRPVSGGQTGLSGISHSPRVTYPGRGTRPLMYSGGVPADVTEGFPVLDDKTIRRIKDSFRTMTDEEHDEIMAERVRDGIMDEEGNVLKRMPDPPEWLTQANGRTKLAPEPAKPTNKSKRPRKRS